MEEQLMSLVDASALLRIPYHAAWRLTTAGILPARRISGRWFCDRLAVLAFAANREPPSIAAATPRGKARPHHA